MPAYKSVKVGRRAVCAIFAALGSSLNFPAWADTPLARTASVRKFSANKRYSVVSSATAGTFCVAEKSGKVLWRIKQWFRDFYVSDDGEHLVSIFNGLNLLPVDYGDDVTLLIFWKSGRAQRRVRAIDLIPDRSVLERTSSHYLWNMGIGIDGDGHLYLNRVDGIQLVFDLDTATQLRAQPWEKPRIDSRFDL
jgi:hypothetical protein